MLDIHSHKGKEQKRSAGVANSQQCLHRALVSVLKEAGFSVGQQSTTAATGSAAGAAPQTLGEQRASKGAELPGCRTPHTYENRVSSGVGLGWLCSVGHG